MFGSPIQVQRKAKFLRRCKKGGNVKEEKNINFGKRPTEGQTVEAFDEWNQQWVQVLYKSAEVNRFWALPESGEYYSLDRMQYWR